MLNQVLELIEWVSDIQATSRGAALLSPNVPRTKLMLKFTDRFMNKSRNELTAYDASEGALYVIFCALLCLLPQAPQLLAIDNLDQALNPRLLTKLTSRLSGCCATTILTGNYCLRRTTRLYWMVSTCSTRMCDCLPWSATAMA